MPIASAALSLSLIATKALPGFDLIRFFAKKVIITTKNIAI
jgi:hypothetical protein